MQASGSTKTLVHHWSTIGRNWDRY